MVEQTPRNKIIGLIGFEPDLQSLLEMTLDDEGYASRTLPLGPTTANDLAQAPPDLLLFEAGRNEPIKDSDRLVLIDALRVRGETNAIPVIVLGTLEPRLEQAQASGTVYRVLAEPFDLEELLQAVHGAVERAPFEARIRAAPAESNRACQEAADILVRAERNLMLDWVQRIRTVEPFATRTDISTCALLATLPRVVSALILVLRHQAALDVVVRDDEVRDRIRAHAETRRRQIIPAAGVVCEYEVLREVLTDHLQREMSSRDVQAALKQINAQLDEAIRTTINEYGRIVQSQVTVR